MTLTQEGAARTTQAMERCKAAMDRHELTTRDMMRAAQAGDMLAAKELREKGEAQLLGLCLLARELPKGVF